MSDELFRTPSSEFPSGYEDAFNFPLVSALQGRLSRRFSLGAEIPNGPLK